MPSCALCCMNLREAQGFALERRFRLRPKFTESTKQHHDRGARLLESKSIVIVTAGAYPLFLGICFTCFPLVLMDKKPELDLRARAYEIKPASAFTSVLFRLGLTEWFVAALLFPSAIIGSLFSVDELTVRYSTLAYVPRKSYYPPRTDRHRLSTSGCHATNELGRILFMGLCLTEILTLYSDRDRQS